jgi:hypothetical protein
MRFRIPDYPKQILDIPLIYTAFQKIVGYSKFVHKCVNNLLTRHRGVTLIDLGCGPCDLLSEIRLEGQYFGIDSHGPFINKAKALFPAHSDFLHEASIVDFEYDNLKIDSDEVIFLALGLLHHLSDDDVRAMLKAIKKLQKKITLFSIDPVLFTGQNLWSKFLANSDRGQYVREDAALINLMREEFFRPDSIKLDDQALNTRMHLMIATWTYLP